MCHLSLHFWESEKESLFQVSCHWGIICVLGITFRVGKNTVQDIVRESGKAIWKVLQPIYKYITVPTSEDWLRIADEFNEICKMRNCIGGIDGKHCLIKCPPNAGFLCFNYKSFHSMNLLGVVDANCCFTLIDVGAQGRDCHNSVFCNSSFGKAFSSGDLNVLPIRNIPGTSISIPLYFVGDVALLLMLRK